VLPQTLTAKFWCVREPLGTQKVTQECPKPYKYRLIYILPWETGRCERPRACRAGTDGERDGSHAKPCLCRRRRCQRDKTWDSAAVQSIAQKATHRTITFNYRLSCLDGLIFDLVTSCTKISVSVSQRAPREEGQLLGLPTHADKAQLPISWPGPRASPGSVSIRV